MKSVTSIFIFFAFFASAQEVNKYSVGISASVTRMDYFLQFNYQLQRNHLELSAGAGIGTLRTISQGRFFPSVTLRGTYYFLDRPKIQLGPTLSLNYSALKVNSQSKHSNFWQQYAIGYVFTAGKRLKFVQITEIGPLLETYYNDFDKRNKTVGTLGYSLQIGLRYAL